MEPSELRDQMRAKLASHHAEEASFETALDVARQVDERIAALTHLNRPYDPGWIATQLPLKVL